MKLLFLSLLIILTATSYASQKAVTDTGEEIILNANGTWKYANEEKNKNLTITQNKTPFFRPKDSKFLLKSTINKSAYWVNTDKWKFSKPEDDTAAEYEFNLKGKDLYALAISEEIEIPVESLADFALSNAQVAVPDAKILTKEYRTVNGNKVIYMEMGGTMSGMNVVYSGYYYSGPSGSTQLITYTAANLVDKYKPEIYKFLNGLVVTAAK